MTEACFQLFDQLRRRFFYKDKGKKPTQVERNFVIAVCRSWFDEYRNNLAFLGIEEKFLLEIDDLMRSLLSAANSSKRRIFYRQQILKANRILEMVLPDAQIAEWNAARNKSFTGDINVLNSLKNLDPDLERRYLQVIYDLQDQERISYAGTANELRELIRITLSLMAPDTKVMKMKWFRDSLKEQKEKRKTPTKSDRVRFIMEKRKMGSKGVKNTQENEKFIEGLLCRVINSSYDRINIGVHGQEDRKEIIRSLRYVHAFLLDILPN